MSSLNRSNFFRWFATCPRGLEEALAHELHGLAAQEIQLTHGGVAFQGATELGYRVNLESRVASRVLREVAQGFYKHEDDIFKLAFSINWPAYFKASHTLRVETVAIRSPLKSIDFITLRVKDAICDRFRQADGVRPSIDTENPDVRVHVFLTDARVTLYLDTSGATLFKRGWRLDKVAAPLRENLAAGLLQLAGWNGTQPLLDPFCGSGTLAVEAAHIAQQIAPGIARPFGFEKLNDFDKALWRRLKSAAEQRRLNTSPVPIFASDISGRACGVTSQNAKRAGVDIQVSISDARALQTPTEMPGLLIGNPPYGERVTLSDGAHHQINRNDNARKHSSAQSYADPDESFTTQPDTGAENSLTDEHFFAEFGSTLKKNFAGWRVALISNDMKLPSKLRLKPTRKIPVFNGALECRLFIFDMVVGSNRKQA